MALPGAVTDPSSVTSSWVDIPVGGRTIRGYQALPTRGDSGASIVVLHDAFGLFDHFQDVARRYANVGYRVLAPDMYDRLGGLDDPEDREKVFGLQFAMKDSETVADVAASAARLRTLDGANGKVGAIGYCAGGRQVLLTACSTDVLDAGIDCWGGGITRATPTEDISASRPVKVIDLVQYLSCPLFVVAGAEDRDPSPEIANDLWARMQAAGKDGKLTIYPDAGHAFFADYRPAAFRPEQAERLWHDSLEFFASTLR